MARVVQELTQQRPAVIRGRTPEVERAMQVLSEGGEVALWGSPEEDEASFRNRIQEASPGTQWISTDLYYWLDGAEGSSRLVRFLPVLNQAQATLWLLGPDRNLPAELQRVCTVVDLPLPTRDELVRWAEEAMTQAGKPHDASQLHQWGTLGRGMTEREWKALLREATEGPMGTVFTARIQEAKTALLRSSAYLELETDIPSLDSLGGLDVLKEWLGSRQEAMGPRAEAFGLPTPKGLLLLGIQGCGKSLSARVIAATWGLPLARLDLGQLFRSTGSPEAALRESLKTAESLSPMVLWIDEIDKTFSGMESGASDTLRRLFGTFITWLQEKKVPVFVVATANEVAGMPPELLRKGRFDEIFFVDLPDVAERREVLRIHIQKHGRNPEAFDLDSLARSCEFFSGAEIAEAVVSGLYAAFSEKRELENADISLALQTPVPLYFTYEERIKAFREWAMDRARNASRDKRVLDLFQTS